MLALYKRNTRQTTCCLRLSGAPLRSTDLTACYCVQARCHGDVATGFGRRITGCGAEEKGGAEQRKKWVRSRGSVHWGLSGAPLGSTDLTACYCVQASCHGGVATGFGRRITGCGAEEKGGAEQRKWGAEQRKKGVRSRGKRVCGAEELYFGATVLQSLPPPPHPHTLPAFTGPRPLPGPNHSTHAQFGSYMWASTYF